MPPPETHKTLGPRDIALLERWIKEGAPYEAHWAFIAPERPALPDVRQAGLVANPIDRFVLARLEAEGLTPNPEADRHTLIRRVTLDLTGLPPTPAEIDAFVRDTSPKAYETLVDRLLARPSYGEHRARYWLDAVRYADTHGYHFDNYRSIWPYRDWVIDAFNANQPFDRFTHRAACRRPAAEGHARSADRDGLQPRGMSTNEGGTIPEENLANYATRSRRDHLAGLAGADHGLRAVPRPQVRPDHREGVLQHGGVLPEHDAAGHGRQRQGLAAGPPHPTAGGRARATPRCLTRSTAASEAYDVPPRGRRARLRELAADPGREGRPDDLGRTARAPAPLRPDRARHAAQRGRCGPAVHLHRTDDRRS